MSSDKHRFEILTLFPEMMNAFFAQGVVGQAVKRNILAYNLVNPRDFTADTHRTVDDRPYGGGDGMVMLCDPLEAALRSILDQHEVKPLVLYMSPQGQPLTDNLARHLSRASSLVLICGRYSGVDQRFINRFVDKEISIGDYVISGGELAAMVVVDATARFIPGVLGNEESSEKESFSDGLLEAPVYTRPREKYGQAVPETLLSGHHARVADWRKTMSILKTWQRRPDLLEKSGVSKIKLEQALGVWKSLSKNERETLGLDANWSEAQEEGAMGE